MVSIWKQNVAKCFCKVLNHAQFFTLNTSDKNTIVDSISKTSMLFQIQSFFMIIFRDFQGLRPRARRDIGIAKPRHSKTCFDMCLETETCLEKCSTARLCDKLKVAGA